jgi:hypothetical protein
MPKLNYYRQRRVDGGLRSAISVDDTIVLHVFEPGDEESDPALRWYVDVRSEGTRLPTRPADVRQWYQDQREIIETALRALADELRAGIDIDSWPLQRSVPGAPRGVRIKIVSSAVRRVDALQLSDVFLDLADHWDEYLLDLQDVEVAHGS